MLFESLEAIADALLEVSQYEAMAKFAAGDVLVEAVQPAVLRVLGLSQESLLRAVGERAKLSRRSLYKRLRVARTFPPEVRNPAVSWEAHYLCATTDEPLAWLHHAADHNLTTEQLRQAIRAAGGDPARGDLEFLVRGEAVTVVTVSGDVIALRFPAALDVQPGDVVHITVSREKQQRVQQPAQAA